MYGQVTATCDGSVSYKRRNMAATRTPRVGPRLTDYILSLRGNRERGDEMVGLSYKSWWQNRHAPFFGFLVCSTQRKRVKKRSRGPNLLSCEDWEIWVKFIFFFFWWKWSTIFHRFVSIICVFKSFAYHQFIHIQDSLFIYIRFIQIRNLFVYYLFASICQPISYPYTFSRSSILPLPCLFTVLIYSLIYSLLFPNVNLLIVALYFTFNRCAIVIHEIVYAIAEHVDSILVVERY